MKNSIILILILLSGLYLRAQHPCAQSKIAHLQHHSAKTTVNSTIATRLMMQYDLHHYGIDLHTELSASEFSGVVDMDARAVTTIDTFCFQLSPGLALDSVLVDGSATSFIRIGDDVLLPLTSPRSSGQSISVRASYQGQYVQGGFFNGGINKTVYPSTFDTTLFSFSAIYTMKDWLPAKEMIYDKIDSVDIWVTTELGRQVGSNGLLLGIDTIGSQSRFRWKTRYPIDYYLISIAVGDYEVRESYVHTAGLPYDSILVQNFIFSDHGFQNLLIPMLDANDEMMDYYSEHFGLYPFAEEKYGNCFVKLGGGMEHQTMTTVGLANLSVLSHELFHQWFGDLVTCQTWHDIAINEGFASYGQVLTEEHLYGEDAARDYRKFLHDEVKQLPGGSVYCPDTVSLSRVFSGRLSYDKGAVVIGTLRYIIGDGPFFGGLQNFLGEHAFSTASLADLQTDMENFTGLDLDDYFMQWIYGEGYPEITVKYRENVGGKTLVQLSQTTTVPSSVSFFRGPIDLRVSNNTGDTLTYRLEWGYQDELFELSIGGTIDNIEVDPDHHVLHSLVSVKEDRTLSLSDFETQNMLSLYPNPTQDILTLHSDRDIVSYAVFDMLGRMIHSGHPDSSEERVSTEGWTSGTYVLTVELSDGHRLSQSITKI